MIFDCIWKRGTAEAPKGEGQTTSSHITIYDGGEYVGYLFGDEWKSYRVLSRKRVGEEVHEELELMPQDWVPFEVVSA